MASEVVVINQMKCDSCAEGKVPIALCYLRCQEEGIGITIRGIYVDPNKCTGCKECITVCPKSAITVED